MSQKRGHKRSEQDLRRDFARLLSDHYDKMPIFPVRARGSFIWDTEGRQYIDAVSGYSCLNLGHRHPAILAAIRDWLEPDEDGTGVLQVVPNVYGTPYLLDASKMITSMFGYDKVCWMNSGAEAVETALKLARKWGYLHGKANKKTHSAEVVVMDGNFHGRTTGIISFSSENKYKAFFGPYMPGYLRIAFGDAAQLDDVLAKRHNIVAVLIEPIQGEGGVIIPPTGYLKAVRESCTRHDVLMIADEIQTGLGRTGALTACDHDGIRPDLLILGKSLGGGVEPVSAILGNEQFMVFTPGEHGSTYAGNPLAMIIAKAVLETIERDGLCGRTRNLGAHFQAALTAKLAGNPLVSEVRGRGLMIGIELVPGTSAKHILKTLLDSGVICKDAHGVIRISPPLTTDADTLDDLVNRIVRAFTIAV